MESDFAWWIDHVVPQRRFPERLDNYGCFPTKEMAEEKIAELKRLPCFHEKDLITSKQVASEQEKKRMKKMLQERLKRKSR